MPLTPEVPPVVPVQGPPVSQALTTYQITKMEFFLNPNGVQIQVRVVYHRGYMSNGVFVTVDVKEAVLEQDVLAPKINATTTGQHTLYEEVKTAVWELLQSGGFVPAGTIG